MRSLEELLVGLESLVVSALVNLVTKVVLIHVKVEKESEKNINKKSKPGKMFITFLKWM